MIQVDDFLKLNNRVLKTGWVCYDDLHGWRWATHKPIIDDGYWALNLKGKWKSLDMFCIIPYKPWCSSLRKVVYWEKVKKVVEAKIKKGLRYKY